MINPEPIIQKTEYRGNHLYLLREDLIPYALGGSKVRIALAHMEHLRSRGFTSLIVYGKVTSNLVRAAASLCASSGIPCHVIYRIDPGDRTESFNRTIAEKYASRIYFCTGENVAVTVGQALRDAENAGEVPYYIYGDIYGNGNEEISIDAYRSVGKELRGFEERNGETFDFLFCPAGTCVTFTGLMSGHARFGQTTYVAVSVARSAERIQKDILRFTGGKIDASRYSILPPGDDSSFIPEIYRQYGLALDPVYTAKAFSAMDGYISSHQLEGRRILFVHTGSTPLHFDYLCDTCK